MLASFAASMLWALAPYEWKGIGERLLMLAGLSWVMVISLAALTIYKRRETPAADR